MDKVKLAKDLLKLAKQLMVADNEVFNEFKKFPKSENFNTVCKFIRERNDMMVRLLEDEFKKGDENFEKMVEFTPMDFYDTNNSDTSFKFTFKLNPVGEYQENGQTVIIPQMLVDFQMVPSTDEEGNTTLVATANAYYGSESAYSCFGKPWKEAYQGAFRGLSQKFREKTQGLVRVAGEDAFCKVVDEVLKDVDSFQG